MLLAVLLFPLAGHLVFFQFRKMQLRYAFKEILEHSIPKVELVLIKIPADWLQRPPAYFQPVDKKEFRLRGEMYDIVYQEQKGNTFWNYCLADKAEILLFAQLDQWVQQQSSCDPFEQGQTLQLERLLNSLFTSTTPILAHIPAGADISTWPPYIFSILPWVPEVVNPPPEMSC